ncbi:ABC transporter permease [Kocuria sp. CNJ-770]|uniref:ABC transporter permease n=1 Tax=Kocuria oceani TaxID=988827 RepID=A0ABV9TFA8_9MICC|nr:MULTISPECIES: ABC transporter permease [Kocuria]OLT05490.1 ABC transporter permease [Kocuria sp. CNJ-770]
MSATGAAPAVAEQQSVPPPTATTPDAPRRTWLGSALQSVLAIVAALVLGGLLIAVTDERVADAAGYFFARPGDTLAAMWAAASSAYEAMFYGAVYNPSGTTFAQRIYPLTETLTVATPLILAGLGVAVAFRAGLFNIGAQGQLLIGAALAAWVGFAWQLPVGVHLLAVVLAGALGGALWGGIVGLLKARTGAHEVILTIMLNYIALNLVAYLLTRPAFLRPGSSNPISPQVAETAMFPRLLGEQFRLHWGFVLAVLATVFVAWLLHRSTVGFELRAVGANPRAARTAGISVTRGYVVVMLLAGALAGLAGVAQIAGTERALTSGIAASFGFDAITVALLGRSRPWGTFFAGLLYGAFRAGGVTMQSMTGTNIDIVLVVQSLIVLFIALPPLLRTGQDRVRRRRGRGTTTIATEGARA